MSTYIEHDNKEIGSYFSIAPQDIEKSQKQPLTELTENNLLFYSTCRSAIRCILESLNDTTKKALLPAFTCHAVVEPFVTSGYEVHPYPINKDLSINLEVLEKMVNETKPSVILVHDYFGFNSNSALKSSRLLERYRSNGMVVIEDLTQSMFSGYEHIQADYRVGSIRKWMGIPDGAFLKGPDIMPVDTQDDELVEAKKGAMTYKHYYITLNEGNKAELLSLYRKAEDILDSRDVIYGMSSLSKKLFSLYDVSKFCSERRDNATALLTLLKNIRNIGLPFRNVEGNEIPFYIPVIVERNRKELQQFLAQNGVFATVIWGCPDEFVNQLDVDSQLIYDKILCIPCDQRYTVNDMTFIGELFVEFERR